MRKKESNNKVDYFRSKCFSTIISGKKEKWIEFQFYDPIMEEKLFIWFGNSQNKIRMFFSLWDIWTRCIGDCEITIGKDIKDKLSNYLIEMGTNYKQNDINEDNIRSIRFESSDKVTKRIRSGMSGNIIIIACRELIQIIIHFDDPREGGVYSLAMNHNTIIEFANQINAVNDEN
jgi:hypothetical protein